MSNRDLSEGEMLADDLTWREQDVLILLAERLTNREIAERLHLAETTVKDYVGKILSKLYVKNRRQAVAKAKNLGLLEQDKKTVAGPPANLPSAPTLFIGRRNELEEIKGHLRKTRLLTLTGPGGIGKTRLALQTAEEAAGDFSDGSFFVSLAPIHTVDHIVQTIAEAVNFPLPTHEDPQHQLLRYLKRKQLLLVMDNFEHLMDGVGIVSEILQSASGVKILATSREKLNLHSETNLTISGMSILEELPPKDAEQNDAVTLFLQSANKVQPGFDPSPEELVQIAEICQIVQGMPLAIELAASWLHILSVDEIADELEKGIDILATEVRDLPERHRSIRSVFEHSWSLLAENEQEIFKQLSVFRDGFTREAALQIAGASIQHIAGLVNKSFLTHNPVSGRFEIHELLRQYAQEQLEATPKAKIRAHDAHANYYAVFMQEKFYHLKDHRLLPALTEIEADIENVRAAWNYWVEKQEASQMGKFISSFWMVYWVRGWNHAAVNLFRQAVEALSAVDENAEVQTVRATAMANEGFFMCWVGLAEQGYQLAKESVEILEKLNSPMGLALAFNNLTLAAYYLNLPSEEKEAAQKFVKAARVAGDKWLLALSLWFLSLAEFRAKNYSESKQIVESSLKISEEIQDPIGKATCFTTLGQIALIHGELSEAEDYLMRCLHISQKIDFLWLSSNAIKYLGQVALLQGNIAKAQTYLVQSLRIAHDLGLERDVANHLFDFASLRVAQDKLAESVELLSLLLQQPASQQARLGGGSISDNARELLAKLEKGLSSELYIEAMKRGEQMELDSAIIELVNS